MFSTYSSSSAFDKPSPSKKGASTRGRRRRGRRRFFADGSSVCCAAKKPTDAAPKPRKPPAPKAKKPDKSIWDSDSDGEDKKPSAGLKGTAQVAAFSSGGPQRLNHMSSAR